MVNPIVKVSVFQIAAPAPNTLQQKGALISQGGTNLSANSTSLLTSADSLSALVTPASAISALEWAANIVTVTTSETIPFADGDNFTVVISGVVPAGFNGTFAATVTGTNTFTYPLATDPGTATAQGDWQPYSAIELQNMVTEFFAQGSSVAVSVLELGPGTGAQGVTALSSFITESVTQPFYSYLVPAEWSAESSFITLVNQFQTTTSKTYFFTTMTLENYSSFTTVPSKAVFGLVPAPTAPATEFTSAAPFFAALQYNPSAASRVTPFAFSYLYDVTPYPLFGNGTTLANLKTANVNYVGTGAEGGISNAVLFWGTTMDDRDFSYWYSVDWAQINLDLMTANTVINGSNSPAAPLYYNQDGINRLQGVAAGVMNTGISYGLVYGTVIQTSLSPQDLQTALDAGTYAGYTVVNAVPFNAYVSANPSNFSSGTYGGLTVIYSPNRGFKQIIYNLTVTDIVAV